MKKRAWAVLFICLLLCMSLSCSASAFVVEFDSQKSMEPVVTQAVGIAPVSPQGAYIAGGSCGITIVGTKKVQLRAETSCYQTMSKVTATVGLYKKSGSDVTSETYSKTITAYVSGNISSISVAAGYYYAQGGHNVYKSGSLVETVKSSTSTIYVG